MIAGLYDITCVKGSDLNKTIYIKNPDNSIADLSLWASKMQIRRRTTSETYLIELSSDNGMLVHDTNNGTITIVLSAETTDTLPLSEYVYDIELYTTFGEPVVCKLLKGFFWVI